jgi:hypothetical protein
VVRLDDVLDRPVLSRFIQDCLVSAEVCAGSTTSGSATVDSLTAGSMTGGA